MLPVINHVKFFDKLPISEKEISFRPLTVREEKVLLLAYQSKDNKTIINGIKDILQTCSGEDVSKLHIMDLEYLLILIRAASVTNIVDIQTINPVDEKEYSFQIDLNKILRELKFQKPDKKIMLTENGGLYMKDFTIDLIMEMDQNNDTEIGTLISCIDYVWTEVDGEEVLTKIDLKDPTSTISRKELEEWFDTFGHSQMEAISKYMNNIPRVKYVHTYKTEDGSNGSVTLEGMNDFLQ